ncbi:uncharacterized protein LOC119597420 [Penaeus monodon]|uniref:uncharacterized protein LOC119597420 n=1 Tax=Penaeus monodon TaxID=6687 RepID=UPI0018A6E596|nr:uncharacterized protein LOC119597420 [Penaeus monodon]
MLTHLLVLLLLLQLNIYTLRLLQSISLETTCCRPPHSSQMCQPWSITVMALPSLIETCDHPDQLDPACAAAGTTLGAAHDPPSATVVLSPSSSQPSLLWRATTLLNAVLINDRVLAVERQDPSSRVPSGRSIPAVWRPGRDLGKRQSSPSSALMRSSTLAKESVFTLSDTI